MTNEQYENSNILLKILLTIKISKKKNLRQFEILR